MSRDSLQHPQCSYYLSNNPAIVHEMGHKNKVPMKKSEIYNKKSNIQHTNIGKKSEIYTQR